MQRKLRQALAVFGLALLGSVVASEASAQCTQPEVVDIPDGFMVGAHLTALSDVELAQYLIGFVNGTMFSIVLGSDRACVDQLKVCVQGRPAGKLVEQVRLYIAARPEMMRAHAMQVSFNAIFGACFTEFLPARPGDRT